MHTRLRLLVALVVTSGVFAAPTIPTNQTGSAGSVTQMSSAEVESYIPFSWFAAAAYCPQPSLATWTCGSCQAPPVKDLVVYASGGDGKTIQNWFVGWWPSGNSIIVSHQGTSVNIAPVLRDATMALVPIDPTRFPGAPAWTLVHKGFQDGHGLTATQIQAAVKQIVAERGATKVTVVGHSLGGSLAILDGLYLRLVLPHSVDVAVRTFGQPRVGNKAFAEFVDTKVPDLTRVTLKGDIVPVSPISFFGFYHTSGERHLNRQNVYNNCPGQENSDNNCSNGDVLTNGVYLVDHLGLYPGGVGMGPAELTPASLC